MVISFLTTSFLNLIFLKESVKNTDRLDRAQWKQYQNYMQDIAGFQDLIHSIEFEDGLKAEIAQSKQK